MLWRWSKDGVAHLQHSLETEGVLNRVAGLSALERLGLGLLWHAGLATEHGGVGMVGAAYLMLST